VYSGAIQVSNTESGQASQKQQLARHIGLFALTLYGVGDILGAGIYGLVGKAAGQMGNAVWLAFLASTVAAGLTGLSYASLGSRYPKAGGASFVTHLAYRRGWLAYGVGLAALASGLTSMATGSRVFAGYFEGMFPNIPHFLIIVGFGLALGAIVVRGIKESIWLNSICTVIELGGLLIVIAVGFGFIGNTNYLDATSAVNPTGALGPSIILSGAVLTFYSFVGFEDMLNVGEEVKNPTRTLPLGLLLSVAISSCVYVLISIVAVSVVPADVLANSKQPLVDVVAKAAPWFPTKVFSVISMFAVTNTALLNFIMGSRIMYGMANQRLLPSVLAKVHRKRKTPYVAAGVVLLVMLVLALSGDISSLAKATSVLLLSCFAIVNVALVILKRRPEEPKGSFEVPVFVPILGAIVCLALLAHAKTPELLTAGAILLFIAILWFVLKPKEDAILKMDEADQIEA
jgi:basic amino acid/polyamine antiporter, APA family